jgi:hypothetical protein
MNIWRVNVDQLNRFRALNVNNLDTADIWDQLHESSRLQWADMGYDLDCRWTSCGHVSRDALRRSL